MQIDLLIGIQCQPWVVYEGLINIVFKPIAFAFWETDDDKRSCELCIISTILLSKYMLFYKVTVYCSAGNFGGCLNLAILAIGVDCAKS